MASDHPLEDRYDHLSAEFFNLYYQYFPPHATRQGLHQYDHSLGHYHRDEIEDTLRGMKAVQDQVTAINPDDMDRTHALDYPVLITRMKREIYWIEQWRFWENNPLFYKDIITEGCFNLLSRAFAPEETRLEALINRENEVPGLLLAARNNLVNPPAVYTQQAIRFMEGAKLLFREAPRVFSDVKNSALLNNFTQANNRVLEELDRFLVYLQEDLLPRSNGNFAVGEAGIQAIIDAEEMIDVPVKEILQRCYHDLEKTGREITEIGQQINPKATAEELFARVLANHPTRDDLLPTMRSELAKMRAYLSERNLMTLPEELPDVMVTPMYSYASASAMMLTPGPFEQVAREAYLVTNIPGKDWEEDRIEAQLREFNIYDLVLMLLHEAYPGHHTQFYLEKRVPIFASRDHDSDSNSDGWAEYGKYMMVEEIYGELDPLYRLAVLRDKLSMISAGIAGIEIHTENWTLEQAADFLVSRGKQSRESAWRILDRAIYYPSHITYYIGGEMVLKLREDYRKLKGDHFSLKEFHDRFLTYGLIPIKVIRMDMLGESDDGILF